MNFTAKRYCSSLIFVVLGVATLLSQPAGYYLPAEGKTGTELQQALHEIIDNHTAQTYASLWTWFQTTDKKSDGTVWDMYSDIPGGNPPYVYQFVADQCGNYDSEGDCYNREHSFPKSWFNDLEPMYTDLFHLYPTDGWVNNKRGNYPLGVTGSPSWTSSNGSKLGNSSWPGYSGIVFEPINAYKGDLARTMFYMAVRYYGEDTGWPGSDMVTGSQMKEWALKMCIEWHKNDPVSQKERDRNESVYLAQGNRNPFIDNPAWVELIWGSQSAVYDETPEKFNIKAYPNPANVSLRIEITGSEESGSKIAIIDLAGRNVISFTSGSNTIEVDISQLPEGVYILNVNSGNKNSWRRIVVSR